MGPGPAVTRNSDDSTAAASRSGCASVLLAGALLSMASSCGSRSGLRADEDFGGAVLDPVADVGEAADGGKQPDTGSLPSADTATPGDTRPEVEGATSCDTSRILFLAGDHGDPIFDRATGYDPHVATHSVSSGTWRSSVSVSHDSVEISIYAEAEWWTLRFASDSSARALTVGSFPGATKDYEGRANPVVEIGGNGIGCSADVGSFSIERLSFDGDALREIAVSFNQVCDSSPSPLHGCLRWVAE